MSVRAPDCGEVIRELWDWLDDELDRERWTSIRDHLAACAGCAAHRAFAESFLREVQRAPAGAEEVAALRERVRTAMVAAD